MMPIPESLARKWRREATADAPVTIAFDVWHSRPAHPDLQKKLGANISIDEFHALFPNSNLWTSDTTNVLVFEVERDELHRMSARLAMPEIIFVDEEGR